MIAVTGVIVVRPDRVGVRVARDPVTDRSVGPGAMTEEHAAIDDTETRPPTASSAWAGDRGACRSRRRDRRSSPAATASRVDRAPEEPLGRADPSRPTPRYDDARAAVDGPPAERTVGRLIADALRAAGVRYAFTVPGESFLGLLEPWVMPGSASSRPATRAGPRSWPRPTPS